MKKLNYNSRMNTKRLSKNEYLQGKALTLSCREAESVPLHAHEYYELELVLSGEGEQTLGDEILPISAGSMYLLTPADFHEFRPYTPVRLWNISFAEEYLPPDARAELYHRARFVRLNESSLQRAAQAASLLHSEAQSGECTLPILTYLLHFFAPEKPRGNSPVERAKAFIRTHFRENPSLSEVADFVGLSRGYFSTLFKEQTGKTFIDFLTDCKIDCAKLLLQNGMSVTDTCFASGFGTLSGFGYAFRKKEGISPSEYQRKTKI